MSGVSLSDRRLLSGPRAERGALVAVLAGIVAYAIVALWLTRGTTFSLDDLAYFGRADGFAPSQILEPYNGHLIATTQLLYVAALKIFGPEFVVIKLAMIVYVSATSLLLFLLLRSRIGGPAAAAPAILILFLGTSPVVLQTNVMVFAQATAFGLGALLALERGTLRGDVVACVLLVIGVASIETCIAFAVGAAALLALRGDLVRRSWVFIVPGILYIAWYVWAQKFDEPSLLVASNVLLIPNYAADSLAAAGGALAGLNLGLSVQPPPATVDLSWGRIVAVGIVAAIVLGLRRRPARPVLVAIGVTLLVIWVLGALSFGALRPPTAARYFWPIAVLAILALAEAHRRRRPPLGTVLAIWGICAFALAGNLHEMRAKGNASRNFSETTEARMAMIELERDGVPPDFGGGLTVPIEAGDYVTAIDRWGPIAPDPIASATETDETRTVADETLAGILQPALEPASGGPLQGCERIDPAAASAGFGLPPGGASLRSASGGNVQLRRFGAEFATDAGQLEPDERAALALPTDAATATNPWMARVQTAKPLEICPLAPGA